MSLIAFQTALGRSVRARTEAQAACDDLDLSPQERLNLARVIDSKGFRATAGIQRSWCESRAARGAQLTLSILPQAERRELVREWVDGGGGTNSFFAAEAEAFLEFIAPRLVDPSHALSLCRLEQAVLRAEAAAAQFGPPQTVFLDDPACTLRRGPCAALVVLFAGLEQLHAAIDGEGAIPPLSQEQALLVAPGLPGLARPAEAAETKFWHALAEPQRVQALQLQGHSRDTFDALWMAGAIEAA
jgi:hypothetical protein